MADVLAEALVELEPDIRNFAKKLGADVRRFSRAIDDSVAGTERQFEELGATGEREVRRIADASEVAQRQTLVGWRENAQGFEKVYRDAATGVERSINVSFQSIIKQQEAQARSAELQIKKLNELAERESRAVLKREEAQGREIARIVQKFDRQRERDSAKLAAAQKKQAEAAAREVERINAQAERSTTRLSERYEEEGRRSADALERTIGVTLQRIGRTAGRSIIDLSVNTAGLSSAIGQATKLGAVLSTLGLGALAGQAGVGGIAAVVASLSETIGVIALLPAAGAAAAVSLNVIKLGIKGVGDALSETDPAKFVEATEKLAPAARDFARAVRAAQPEFDALQRSVQDELFANLAGEVDRLADILLPRFQRRLTAIAAEFSDVALEFTSFITSARTLSDVDRLMERTRKSTDIFTSAIQPLLRGLRDVGAVGAEFLPQLAADVSVASIRLGDFIARARDSGALQEFIQSGIDSTKLLISTFGNLGRAVGGVFRASRTAGGGFLETLEELTQRLDDVINSVDGQETLVEFFGAARQVGKDLLPVLGEIARIIGRDVAPLLADVGSNVLPAVTRTISNLGGALRIATPGIVEFSDGFGDFLDMLNSEGVLDTVGELANVLGTGLADGLREVAPILGEIIVKLGSELTRLLPELIPAVADFANSFGELLKPALDLVGIIGNVVTDVVLPSLTRLADTLTPIIRTVVSNIETTLLPLLPDIEAAFSEMIDNVGPILDDLGEGLVEALELVAKTAPDAIRSLGELLEGLEPVIATLGPVAGTINDINNAFNDLANKLPGFRQVIGDGGLFGLLTTGTTPIGPLQGIFRVSRDLTALFRGELTEGIGHFEHRMISAGENSATSFYDLRNNIADALEGIRTRIAEGAPVFTDILLSELGRMEDGSLNIFGDIFAGLTDLFERTDQKISEELFGINEKVDAAWNRLKDSTSRAFAETEGRIAQGITNASGVVAQFPGLVQSSLGAIGSTLYGSGQALIGGLIAGIKSQEFAAREAAAAVMRIVARVFPGSPAKEGPFSGVGWTPYRGAALIEGFSTGMLSELPAIQRTATMLAEAVSEQLPTVAGLAGDSITTIGDGARTAQRIAALTSADTRLSRTDAGIGGPLSELTPPGELGVPTVKVYIGERELTAMVVDVVDENNGRIKRSVTSRARRTL